MGILNIDELKKDNAPKRKRIYRRHLVVGDDFFALETYNRLIKKYGEGEVGLLAHQEITPESSSLFYGPTTIRGEKNIDLMKELFPDIPLEINEKPSLFYKEQKLRPFGGRSKPEKLLWSEDFFIEKGAHADVHNFFSFLSDEHFFKDLNEKQIRYIPERINALDPDDLVEASHWKVMCENCVDVDCESLYWCKDPSDLLPLLKETDALPVAILDYINQLEGLGSLYINFEFKEIITDCNETLFFPLSYTHDWGHFMGEFSTSKDTQTASFLCFIEVDTSSEEEISKKIKILKKNLEKKFPEFGKHLIKEQIVFREKTACLKIDDSLFYKAEQSKGNLFFISSNAPLAPHDGFVQSFEDSSFSPSYFARGYLSLQKVIGINEKNC